MKRYLLASIALSTVLVGSAFAQAPAPGWNGFYIGGNVGGTLSSGSQGETVVLTPPGGAAGVTNPLVNATQTLSSTGPLGGVQLGWNQQLGNLQLGSLVGGIEGDWAWTDQSEATQNTHFLASTVVVSPAVMSGTTRQDIQWLSTVRGRLGISNGPVFWYATGGLAIGEITSQSALTVT